MNLSNDPSSPLVSVLIPTYNRPQLFELALESALNQTYKNIEIIIGDDSTNHETERLLQPYLQQHPHIRYYKNEKNLGQFENDLKLLELSKGEYINFLMDDDLFHPYKIERMMKYFLNDTKREIKLVTSHRMVINERGIPLGDLPVTERLFTQDTKIDGIAFGNMVIKYNFNCIGEPTTPLFRKRDLKEPFGVFSGRKYGCNVDSATWINLLSEGKIVYMAETLSFFRIHAGQQLNQFEKTLQGWTDYAHMVLESPKKGFLQDRNEYRQTVKSCLDIFSAQMDEFDRLAGDHPTLLEFKSYFSSLNDLYPTL